MALEILLVLLVALVLVTLYHATPARAPTTTPTPTRAHPPRETAAPPPRETASPPPRETAAPPLSSSTPHDDVRSSWSDDRNMQGLDIACDISARASLLEDELCGGMYGITVDVTA